MLLLVLPSMLLLVFSFVGYTSKCAYTDFSFNKFLRSDILIFEPRSITLHFLGTLWKGHPTGFGIACHSREIFLNWNVDRHILNFWCVQKNWKKLTPRKAVLRLWETPDDDVHTLRYSHEQRMPIFLDRQSCTVLKTFQPQASVQWELYTLVLKHGWIFFPNCSDWLTFTEFTEFTEAINAKHWWHE